MNVPDGSKPLQGQTAIITGAGRGIGRAIALTFARAGASVVLASRTKEQLDETAREVGLLGGHGVTLVADVSRNSTSSGSSEAIEHTGRVDIVVNNAGVFLWKALANLEEDEWDRILDTNLKSAYLMIRAALPQLIRSGRGRIVNVASIHGTVGDANVVAHCAAKFGLIGLTKALARELREVGVTVNAVCPGSTDNRERDTHDGRRSETPLKEKLSAFDVADAALYLASPGSAAVSGAVLDIWGGTYLSIKG
jgi:3-oxoacyl-[acyl-carrier protein] reductase